MKRPESSCSPFCRPIGVSLIADKVTIDGRAGSKLTCMMVARMTALVSGILWKRIIVQRAREVDVAAALLWSSRYFDLQACQDRGQITVWRHLPIWQVANDQ